MYNKLSVLFILFIIYSFLGWLMEVIGKLIEDRKFINRGFLIGPYCPIYGWGCILIINLLNKYIDHPIILFLMAIIICSTLEYLTSYLMEKIFNARWWDYTRRKFNLNGRICLETMIPFGILSTIVVYIINPAILNFLNIFNVETINIIATILFILFIIDNIISINVINNVKNTINRLEKDQTEEITKKVKELLLTKGILYKRIIKAFPTLKTYKERLIELQNKISKEIEKINIKK